MNSPLLFPVKLDKDRIMVFDETLPPFKEEHIEIKDLDKALWALKEMKTRSLGQVLLFFYSCVLFGADFSIDDIAKQFKQNRPTFDFFMLAHILKEEVKKGLKAKEAVDKFIYGFDFLRKKRAKELAQILPESANILTICNVNGELIYLYDELKKAGKQACFFVCETRPYLQGTRLTFWELRKNDIKCKLICDSQAASLMQKKKVNCVVTGADRATKKGDVINKAGTYSLALLAKHFNIPFYPLTQYSRDIDIDSIEIEQRPVHEAFMHLKGSYHKSDSFYPAFDITRAEFVTKPMELKV